jgi:hypothetical protein
VGKSLCVLVLVLGVAGACYVAAPVVRSTWPLMLVALAVAIAFAGVRTVLYAKRELPAARRKLGLCERCGYDLTGNVSGVCPECGSGAGWRAIDAAPLPHGAAPVTLIAAGTNPGKEIEPGS